MKTIELGLPLLDIIVTQEFGKSFLWYDKRKKKVVDFYPNLGLLGHNGVDFRIMRGCPTYATITGLVLNCGKDSGGGVFVEIFDKEMRVKTLHYHLLSLSDKIQKGVKVKKGELIGYCDNTGIWTTADHLHYAPKRTDQFGNTIDKGNGYNGAFDPTPYFPKNWDKSNAYHRYGRKQNWIAEWLMRFRNVWLHKQLIARGRHPLSLSTDECNALVYGGWDFKFVMNDAMFQIWGFVKKEDYEENQIIPFLRNN